MRNKMILKIKNNEIKKIIDERIELLNNNYDGVIKILEKDGLSSFERQKEVDKLISNVGYIKKKLNLNSVKKLSEEIEDKKHLFSDSIRKFISFECNSDELAASCYFVINDLFFSNDEVSYGETNISLRLGYLVHNMIMQNKFYKSNSSDNFSEWMKENSYISDKKFLMELGFNLTNLLIKNEYLVHDLTFKNLKYYKININIKKNEFVNILNLPKLSQIPDYNINNLNSKFIHILDENTLNKFKISEKSVKALNIMKNTRFTINSTFLNNVLDENNIQSYLEEFIEDDLNIVIPSYFYDKMDSLTSTQERRLLRSKYDKVLFKLLYFIDILYISLLLEGRTIFFETFTDWRGRKYYKGYPLSPTAGSFIRSLLTFENTYSDIREKCSLSGDFSPIIKMEESGVIKYNDENHISLDATASGISILGLLSYDENIMGMTNIINIDNTKKDIYSEILNILNKNNEYLNITKGNNFLNRKNIKNLIMCMVYSEGSWSRSKKINNLALGLPGDKIIYKEIFEISKIIEKIFKEYSPKIVNFTNLVIKCLKTIMIKNKKEKNIDEFIILKSYDDYIESLMEYYKQDSIVLKIKILGKTKNRSINENILPLKINYMKIKKAVIPNLIQQIDSYIMNDVIIKLNEKFIKAFYVHDAIYCNPVDSNIVKQEYFNSVSKLILDKHPLYTFLEVNGIRRNEYDELFKEIDSLVESNNIILNNSSPYILS